MMENNLTQHNDGQQCVILRKQQWSHFLETVMCRRKLVVPTLLIPVQQEIIVMARDSVCAYYQATLGMTLCHCQPYFSSSIQICPL